MKIEAKNISKSFGEVQALKNLDFTINSFRVTWKKWGW